MIKMSPEDAARTYIDMRFPTCKLAILGNSPFQVEHDDDTDLDLIIMLKGSVAPFHECVKEGFWKLQVFAMTPDHYLDLFEACDLAGTASLQKICASGKLLRDDGTGHSLLNEARAWIRKGPEPWTLDEINVARFRITQCVSDLVNSPRMDEGLFIMSELAQRIASFYLRVHNCWIGEGKWLYRLLKQQNHLFADQLIQATRSYHIDFNADLLQKLVQQMLEPYGGMLDEGYKERLL